MKYQLKYVRPSENHYGHTNIIDSNGEVLGYFMINRSKNAGINENWNLCIPCLGFKPFETRNELLEFLDSMEHSNDR